MKSTNIKMTDEDRVYLRDHYGTLQNGFKRLLEKDKENRAYEEILLEIKKRKKSK